MSMRPAKPIPRGKKPMIFQEEQHFRRAAFLSSFFQQPFSAAFLSSLSAVFFSSLSQQFLAAFLSSRPRLSSCCGQGLVVSSLSQQFLAAFLSSRPRLSSCCGQQLRRRSLKEPFRNAFGKSPETLLRTLSVASYRSVIVSYCCSIIVSEYCSPITACPRVSEFHGLIVPEYQTIIVS